MPSTRLSLPLDIVIIGGGVAGLWLGNRLKSAGYSFALFESKALGSDQTIASQGMIHGGMKYTLAGTLTEASEAIADMPRHWRDCLCGDGTVDLRHTRILSDHFFMWSSESLASKLTTLFASKITRGRVSAVLEDRRPPLLRNNAFSGSLYKLDDLVIDVPSLVANLAHNIDGHCFKIDWNHARLLKDDQGTVSLQLDTETQLLEIKAQRVIFTAGKGNGELMAELGLSLPAMQLRPLRQVMVKHNYAFDFFGHCVGTDPTPRLTVSSHRLPHGEHIWYLGGSLAEKGAQLPEEELIEQAKQELAHILPWIDLEHAEWATLPIDRAEPRQPTLVRPDNAYVAAAKGATNLLVGWPTKLTLAPNLANQILTRLAHDHIKPGAKTDIKLNSLLPHCILARTPWDIAFPPEISAEERMHHLFHIEEDEE